MKKKKVIMIMLVVLMFVIATSPVLAADITGCESVLPGAKIDAKIANVVHTVILAIQIVVPVVLVIFGMLDLFKGITAQKEDEMKKGQQMFVKRLISAAIIFFVIAIVKLLISFVAGSDKENIMTCANCFLNGASETTGVCNK